MKAIIINESKICFEAFSDDTNVAMLPERIDVGTDYIGKCNTSFSCIQTCISEDVVLCPICHQPPSDFNCKMCNIYFNIHEIVPTVQSFMQKMETTK